MKNFTIHLITLLFLFGCNGVERMYDKGQDGKVIDRVVKRDRKKVATQEELELAELAFKRKIDEWVKGIDRANESDREDKWVTILNYANSIDDLQNKVKHAGEIKAKNGYVAQFEFVDIEAIKDKATTESVAYFEEKGDAFMDSFNEFPDKKHYARQAYTEYENAHKYVESIELARKMRRARELGTVTIVANVKEPYSFGIRLRDNKSSDKVMNELEKMLDLSNSFWIKFDKNSNYRNASYDYLITLELQDVDINYIKGKEEQKKYTEEISEKVRDRNGNVIKDSTGKVLLTYRDVHATVTKLERVKQMDVDIKIYIQKENSRTKLFERTYSDDLEDKRGTCKISGDERAVPNNVKCKTNETEFVDDDEMLYNTLRVMRSRVRKDIERELKDLD